MGSAEVNFVENEVHRGAILWYDPFKSYGFLTDLEFRNRDYFFHKSSLPDGVVVSKDDKVVFKPVLRDGKVSAIDVKPF